MNALRLFPLILAAAACDIVEPSLVTSPVTADVSSEEILNTAAVVLLREGYTVEALDTRAGILATSWLDESSYADQVFLDMSRRSRIAIVFDLRLRQLDVQMTVQKKDGDLPWRNDDLSGGERRRLDQIVASIQDRIGPVAAARVAP